jgi:hypothetical protein
MEHVFKEVAPEEFETAISKAPQEKLDKQRNYANKKLFLNQDHTVGYALGHDGYWGNLFSLVRGGGSAAAKDAVNRGALYGNAFETPEFQNLIDFYGKFGFRPFAREKNWNEGEPDIVHIKLPHAPVPRHLAERIKSGEIQSMSEMSKSERLREIIRSRRSSFTPHPHAYEWHDGHTSHHSSIMKGDLADIEDKGKAFEHSANEQVATVGVPTYQEYAKHFGHIDKNATPHQSNYDYRNVTAGVNDLLKRHGYQVYIAGGKHGKPDLGSRNYDTSHLMIYDPTPDSGGDQGDEAQTKNWRIVHELAHALTREQLNNTEIPGFAGEVYGERPRMGRLGKQRPLRDAMRAVHWEALAAAKQRELSKDLGLNISDSQFAQEMNTVLHDAAHRAVTGRFSEPRKEGFHPSDKMPSLDHTLGLVRQAAEQMGIRGLDELAVKKSEERNMKIPKVKYNVEKACWEGYEMVGMKEKKGRQVPNCVPKKKSEPDIGAMLVKAEEMLKQMRLIKEESSEYAGHMVKANLYKIAKSAQELYELFNDDENVEPWVEEKIAICANNIDTVADYMQYERMRQGRAEDEVGLGEGEEQVDEYPQSDEMTKAEESTEKKYSKKVKNKETGREKTVRYGAKGYTIAPGTSRGDSYCARSAGQMRDHPAAAKDPNSPLRLSRKKWKCSGKTSRKSELDIGEMMAKTEELLGQVRKLKGE